MFLRTFGSLNLALCLASCGGGGFQGASPTLPPPSAPPAIFQSYDAERNAKMATGWTQGMDMSGVSFNDTRTATLITPRHVVMAKHYARPAAAPVIFHDRSGKRIQRKIIGFEAGAGDVMVGLLDEPVPSNYHSYALPASGSTLIGRPVIVSDQKRNLFIHLVASISNGTIAFKHDKSESHGWSKNLVVGDSGNPSFVISGNELVLVETHTTGGPGAGPYYGDPAVQQGVRDAVQKLDSAYRIRTVTIR
ncbi:MAG: hypothetical protein NWS80_00855 [Akkermansiaceae bacterium]|jgi:hypothetical protein|nr:hypothetical protein [Akkermansiaceae bacterium]MDP4778761.1 hypothetical protein [Akkermansiaceae bacterium]